MLPKFATPSAPQYQSVDDLSSKEASRCSFSTVDSTASSENRDEDVFSASGKQFSIHSAESDARESSEEKKEMMVSPSSPVDCQGFPEVAWPLSATRFRPPPPPPPKGDDTEAMDTAIVGDFETTEWVVTEPPPAPSFKPPLTSPPSPVRRNRKSMDNQSVNQTEPTEMTSFDGLSSEGGGAFFFGTPNTTKAADGSFMESVGNVTMDAFGFPLVEPTQPHTPGPKARSSGRATPVPACKSDTPARSTMRPSKSAPALNRLLAHAQMQAHYKEPVAIIDFEPKAEHETKAKTKVTSKSFTESTLIERKLDAAQELLTKVKTMVDERDERSLQELVAVLSTDETNPVMNRDETTTTDKSNVVPPRVIHNGSPESTGGGGMMEGSFDVQESSIELLESSTENIPMRFEKKSRTRKIPTSKFKCSDDNVYCNINLQEVEKAIWDFIDNLDENAGRCGYVVGCIDRVPKVVRASMNDTFSVLEDESLLNRMAAEASVSLLDSLTIDD